MTTTTTLTPIYDSVVRDLGGYRCDKIPSIPPITKRQRHRLAPMTEQVLVDAGFAAKEGK